MTGTVEVGKRRSMNPFRPNRMVVFHSKRHVQRINAIKAGDKRHPPFPRLHTVGKCPYEPFL